MLIVYYIFTVAATASAFSWNYPVFLLLRGVAGKIHDEGTDDFKINLDTNHTCMYFNI